MAINAGQVTLDEAVTIDKRLQTVTRLITDTVHNEVMCLIDPDDGDNTAFLRIKATAPLMTDYGAFVRPISMNVVASGALGALNAAVTIESQGKGALNWEIDTGTLVGTVVFEATLDDTNWFAIDAVRLDGTIIASTTTFADRGALTSTGYSQVRLRVSAFTSGTSNARIEASHAGGFTRVDTELEKAVALSDTMGNLTTPRVGAAVLGWDGTNFHRIPSTVANGLDVDVTRVTGTVSVQIAAETTNRVEVMGDVADDGVAAGNPLQVGVIARNADRTAVANGDISYALGDLLGKQVILPYAVPELFVSGLATLTATTDTAVIAAGAAGVRNYVTSLSASNTSATAVRVDFKDGTTTFISFFVAASGGGAAQSFPVPFRGTAATAVNAALSAAVTDVRVSAQGYRAGN